MDREAGQAPALPPSKERVPMMLKVQVWLLTLGVEGRKEFPGWILQSRSFSHTF